MGWTILAVLLLVWFILMMTGLFALGKMVHLILVAGLVVLILQLYASRRNSHPDVT